jgi:hypothetical protein
MITICGIMPSRSAFAMETNADRLNRAAELD